MKSKSKQSGASAAGEEVHGHGDELGEQHHQQQDHGLCNQEGPDGFDNPLHVDVAGVAGHVQDGAHRRGQKAHDGDDDEHHAEVGGVDAGSLDGGQQHRGQDHDGGGDVHRGAHQQHQQADDQHQQGGAAQEGIQQGGDGGRDVGNGHHPRRHHGGCSQEHDDGGGLGGRDQAVHQHRDLELTVDEDAHNQRIGHADNAGFGGGEFAAAQAHQDQDGEQQGPDAVQQGFGNLFHALAGGGGQVVLFGDEEPHHAQGGGQVDSGSDAAHKQFGDRYAGLDAEDNHGHRGGHDGGKDVAGSHQGGAAVPVVAGADHHGDQDDAQGCGGSYSRAHDAGEQQDGQDGDIAQAAADMAHQGVGKIDDPLGDAAAVHQLTGEHEEGNGHHRKGIGAGKKVLGKNLGVEAVEEQHHAHAAEHQGKADGNPDQDAAHQRGQEYHQRHCLLPPLSSSGCAADSASSTEPVTMLEISSGWVRAWTMLATARMAMETPVMMPTLYSSA